MSSPVRVGVIGAGVLGRYHTKIYSESKNAMLIGVFDPDKNAAEKVADEFNSKAFDSAEALAAECDAVSIAVPATLHCRVAAPLIALGKHILMEKPLAADSAEAEKMLEEAERKNIVFAVGHVERFNPALAALNGKNITPLFIDARREAKYPPPRQGTHRRGTEVSVTLDLMIHDLDLILSFVKSPVKSVSAFGHKVLSPSDDFVSARITFENGSIADVTASRISPLPQRKFTVLSGKGLVTADLSNHSAAVFSGESGEAENSVLDLENRNALADELEDFIACVADRSKTPRVSGRDALAALRLAEKISAAADKKD